MSLEGSNILADRIPPLKKILNKIENNIFIQVYLPSMTDPSFDPTSSLKVSTGIKEILKIMN